MSVEENKALVRRFVEETFNKGNLDAADEILSEDYIHHDPATPEFGPGPEGYKRLIQFYRSAFPDIHIALEDQIASEDKVVDRWTGRGTHRGAFLGFAPTGKHVKATGISIHRIAGGRIVETWNSYDAAGVMQQLGMFPPAAQESRTEGSAWG